MVKRSLIIAVVCMLGMFAGCRYNTKTVYIPSGQAVRLGERVRNVRVWVVNELGEIVEGRMDLPEGWYCLPKE